MWESNILQTIKNKSYLPAAKWETEVDFKRCIVESSKKPENSGPTVETWRNIGIRDSKTGLVYLTPGAMKYDTIVEDDVVVCRLDGATVGGHRKPTIETRLHLAIYKNREEVNAIIHTHPMYSMVYATQGEDIPLIIDETTQAMGDTCKYTQYVLPGSEELAGQYEKALGKEADSCLLYSRGAVYMDENMDVAFKIATALETTARILYIIEAMGEKPTGISPKNIAVMKDSAKNHHGQGR